MNELSIKSINGGLAFVMLFVAGIASAYFSIIRESPVPAFALVYCSFFMFLVWTRPQVALTAIIAVTPFVQDLGGGLPIKFSISEIHLLLAFIVYIIKRVVTRSSKFLGPLSVPVTIYLAVLTWTSLRTGMDQDDIKALIQTFVTCGVTVAVFANMVTDIESMITSFIWLPIFCVPIAVYEIVTGNFNVFGLHKNAIGGSLAAALIIVSNLWFAKVQFIGQRYLKWLLLILVSGLLISLSRGAWIGTILGLSISGLVWGRLTLVIRTLVVAIPVLLLLWFLLPSEKRDYATGFESDRWNIKVRIETQANLQKIVTTNPMFGVGVGLRKNVDATNFVLVTMAESGIVGLAAVIGVITTVGFTVRRVMRLSSSSTTLLVSAIGGGLLSYKLGHGMVDHFWGRGNGTVVWASVGLIIAVNTHLSKRRVSVTDSLTLEGLTS